MPVDVEALKQAVRDRAQQIAETAAQLALDSMKAVCPVGETGDLLDSLEVDPVTETGEGVFTTTIRAKAPYASFTDTGTAEHVEEGSTALSFSWPNGPTDRDPVAFKSVTIPAFAGYNWFSEPMADVWDAATTEAAAG